MCCVLLLYVCGGMIASISGSKTLLADFLSPLETAAPAAVAMTRSSTPEIAVEVASFARRVLCLLKQLLALV